MLAVPVLPSVAKSVALWNCAGLLFFELMFLTFRSMFTALFTFPTEVRPHRPACQTQCLQHPCV